MSTSAGSESTGTFVWKRAVGGSNNDWSGPPAAGNYFGAFCIQLNQTIDSSQVFAIDTDLIGVPIGGSGTVAMTSTQATQVKQLWQGVTDTYGYSPTGLGLVGPSGNQAYAAVAFQLAVWEIANDFDNLSLTSGGFQVYTAGNTRNLAQSWLNNLGTTWTDTAKVVAMASLTNQDQVFLTDDSGFPSVPLPAACPAVVSLLCGAGLMRRRRSAGQI